MPISVIVTDSKINCQYYNDKDFEFNKDTEFSSNLIGSVMERVKVRMKIEIEWAALASETNKFNVTNSATANARIKRDTGKWSDDGISIGDNLKITDASLNIVYSNVQHISDNILILDSGISPIADGEYEFLVIQGLSPLTAIKYKFGIIENSEPINFISKVTGNEQGYYGDGIGFDTGGGARDTNFVELSVVGRYKDWVTGSSRCRFVGNASEAVQVYEIEHDFIILPYFVDGELSNLQNKEITELLEGFNSLKYAVEFDFRTSLSNPSSSKIANVDNILGSTGWFGENFNGFDSNYIISSISYTNDATGLQVSSLLAAQKTNVVVQVQKTNGNWSGTTKSGVYISYLPPESDYTNKDTDLVENFMYDNAFSIANSGTNSGDTYISNVTSSTSGNQLTINFDVEFTSAQKNRILNANDPYYLIGIQAGDYSLSYINSDRVIEIADVEVFQTAIDIPGLVQIDEFRIWKHDLNIDLDPGFSQFEGWIEDGIVSRFKFSLDLSKQAFVNSMKYLFLAYNTVTDEYFELDAYSMPTANYTISGGVQQLELDTNRGYKLADNSQFNKAFLTTGSKVGDLQNYELVFGQKFTWQDWQPIDADTVFYDKTKINNNLNRKSSNYSDINNYEIRIALFMEMSGVDENGQSGNTNYLILSPNNPVDDYDTPNNYTAVIKTFDPDTLVDLDGEIYNNKETLFQITWTNAGGPISDITGFWAIHRIEIENQSGFDIYELSTIRPFPANNPLQPIDGETQLKMYTNSGNVVTECLILPQKLKTGGNYKLSGRIDGGQSPCFKLLEDGQIKLTEDGNFKILE